VARMWEARNLYRVLVRKPLGNRPLRRLRKFEDNINTNSREVVRKDESWIELIQDLVQ
jgi:hypothetical protein